MTNKFGVISSHYWRVIVQATGEEQVFSTLPACEVWIDLVKHTFNDRCMKFDVSEITERTETL